MRLIEGWVPLWGKDIQIFFEQSPNEFVLFYYFLMNAHYKEEPFRKWILGKDYKKEWIIHRGDFLTSKNEIKTAWKYDPRTQTKALVGLKDKGLIQILLEGPTLPLIIRISNYEYFKFAGKEEDRPKLGNVELHKGGDVELHKGLCNFPELSLKNVSTCDKITSQVIINNKIKNKRGGEETPLAEPPPFFNSLENKEKAKREGEVISTHYQDNEAPSEPLLTPKAIYEIYSKELLATRKIPVLSPTFKELKTAEFLIEELKTIENINLAIRRYVLTDKEWYENRAWSLELLREDLKQIFASKVIEKKEAAEKKRKLAEEREAQKKANAPMPMTSEKEKEKMDEFRKFRLALANGKS